jgi:ATP-dependent 26S proteasome regulatory subunit
LKLKTKNIPYKIYTDMSQLLKAFDSLNDFERTSYFALQYDALSSSISIDVPLAETKENIEKVLTSRESAREESVVSTILQLTDGLFSDYLNIKVVCTFNSNLSKVDTASLRKGRMIAMYEFKALSLAKTNDALAKRGFKISNTELTLSDIFNTEQMTYNNIDKNKIGF